MFFKGVKTLSAIRDGMVSMDGDVASLRW